MIAGFGEIITLEKTVKYLKNRKKDTMEVLKNKRRTYGEHLTSISRFRKTGFYSPNIAK
ncbi:MAG: hypothetical protein ACP5QP_06720 [Brevinematia bacterium]